MTLPTIAVAASFVATMIDNDPLAAILAGLVVSAACLFALSPSKGP